MSCSEIHLTLQYLGNHPQHGYHCTLLAYLFSFYNTWGIIYNAATSQSHTFFFCFPFFLQHLGNNLQQNTTPSYLKMYVVSTIPAESCTMILHLHLAYLFHFILQHLGNYLQCSYHTLYFLEYLFHFATTADSFTTSLSLHSPYLFYFTTPG